MTVEARTYQNLRESKGSVKGGPEISLVRKPKKYFKSFLCVVIVYIIQYWKKLHNGYN